MNEGNHLQTMLRKAATAGRVALAILLVGGPIALAGNLPIITDFSPAFGSPGDTVVVNGQNFGGASSVTFNGKPAAALSIVGTTQIHALVPVGATTGLIGVRTSAGSAFSADSFVVIGSGPYITDFSPALGAPGAMVVIDGVNFINVTAVKFNGTNAAFVVVGPTQISATLPANATTGPVAVATPAGTNTTSSNFIATGYGPYVTDFSPNNGRPGDSVWINGLNLGNATVVTFNGTRATFQATAATQLQASVPNGATTGSITVATPLGTNTSAEVFVVGNAPIITDFSPTNGPPGATVVINGANFVNVTAVQFNGTNAAFFVTAPTQIQTVVPANATTGPITVATSAGTNRSAAVFTVLQPPGIIGFTPTTGPPTTVVVISGTNFVGTTDVLFNGTGATFAVNSTTNITANVPANATLGPIIVITPAGTAFSANVFAVTVPTTPTITGFSPGGGPVGTLVDITGTQFVNVTAVRFNGVLASATTVSATEIDATVPMGATTGLITVTTPAGTGNSAAVFVVGPAPLISSLAPTTGQAATLVRITGSGFVGTTAVQFNGVNAPFLVDAASQITTQVPAAAFTGPISVMTPTGTAISATDFIVMRLADLSVQQIDAPDPVVIGASLTNTITVLNPGPSDATGVQLTDRLPAGVVFVSAASTRGSCTQTNGVVTCSLGALPRGNGATMTIVAIPTTVGTITNTATITANETDPSPANNTATAVTTVTAPPLTIRPLAAQRVEIGWPALASGFRLQVAAMLAPSAWRDMTNTATPAGSRLLVTNPVSGNASFYRLQKPAP
ncbi:MAG: IPT/TIG domain-containing protein [Limisphaerales bacterium]